MFRLSAEYEATYNRMLEEVGRNSSISEEALSLFWPMRGHQYEGDLFVIGDGANGTDINLSRQDLTTGKRKGLIAKVRKVSEPKDCPMLWLTKSKRLQGEVGLERYLWEKSNFFRMAKCISLRDAEAMDQTDNEDWASGICYSNLLKVGTVKPPKGEKTPNPSTKLRNTQLRESIDLIRLELEAFRPSRVLVMPTKDKFSPFADRLGINVKSHEGVVQGIAMQDGRQWVITQHPRILTGGTKEFAGQILEAFASLSK